MDNNMNEELLIKPLELKKSKVENNLVDNRQMINLPLENKVLERPPELMDNNVNEKKIKLEEKWEVVKGNMPPYLDDVDKFNKSWVNRKMDDLVQKKEQKQKGYFDLIHNTNNHSKRFFSIIDAERRESGNSRYIYKIDKVPDKTVLGKEYKEEFSERLTDEERETKITNKRSRLFRKNENAKLIEKIAGEFRSDAYSTLNLAITKQAQRMDKEDYNDLSMFMKSGNDKYNIRLVNLYLGKSVKTGPGGFEGQDVQRALDYMAGQLFAINVNELNFKNDTEMTKNAAKFEKIVGQVAAFDRLSLKHNFMESLNEEEQKRLNERLEALRSIAAYYTIRKEIICDKYYKNHYNNELSLDVKSATNDEQRVLGEKLVKSLVLGRSMLGLNGVDVTLPEFRGNIEYTNDASYNIIKRINARYSKDKKRREIIKEAHKLTDDIALKELLSCQTRLEQLNLTSPVDEQKNIQSTMNAVMDRAFVPVQRPDSRTGLLSKIKNRLMLGYRFILRNTIGVVSALAVNLVTGTEALLFESGRKKNAQEKRDHSSVPGRKGETFKEEVVRKNDKGEDIDIYSDVRRGPLVWEKLSAGDPEDPPEVTIMIEQSKRGSKKALESLEMGHAMIGLSYSRYNKMTKRKERYQLKMGFYPGGGLVMGTALSQLGGAIIAGRLDEDNDHNYDISRRYQVKPGDINKILRAAETYADKGYSYYKRNCTTFVVDMAKLVNLPGTDELKEDEMDFNLKMDLLVHTVTAGQDSGIYMGANAISSRMNKMDLDYLNFGQKRFTKEDLDRYYKSVGKGDIIKKGYSPGGVGETLRNSNKGELGAYFNEHKKIKVNDLNLEIGMKGSLLWTKIIHKIPPNQINASDNEAMQAIIGVGDGGIGALIQDENATSEQVRAAHKKVRNAMKTVSRYYTERLGNDASLNSDVMNLLSLYEVALSNADVLYDVVLKRLVKGDVGISRYDFTHTEKQIVFLDNKNKKITAHMKPGEYEGYLLSHKTPEEAIKLKSRYEEIKKIPEKERTKEQKAEMDRLFYDITLANDFASANRYILEKDTFDEKDIKYAFHELPAMEKSAKEGTRIIGDFIEHFSPSFTYQGVIFEKIFGGFRKLKLDSIPEFNDQVAVLDSYLFDSFEKNHEMLRMIIKWYIEGKDKTSATLANDFLSDMEESCLLPAYHDVPAFQSVYVSAFTIKLMNNGSKTATWLINEIDSIKNQGGM